jgi:hypothetical protein
MSKVIGADKIRRTCRVRGREAEGRFGLVRKQLHMSKVFTPGTENEEDVDTALIYDEWIVPKPAKVPTKPTAETKIHPADKLPRRVCFVDGPGRDPNQRYHLLRKGTDISKVLEIGQEGQGFWINTKDIRDEHLVPVPTKVRIVERKPVRLCKLVDTGEQEYLVLRVTSKGAKLLPVFDGNYGILVSDLNRIVDDHVINKASRKGRKSEAVDHVEDNGEPLASEDGAPAAQPDSIVAQPVPPAPQVARPAPQIAQPAQPVRPAPTVAQPPRPAQPGQPGQPVRPAPTVAQPARPVTMTAGPGVARPVPQGRPVTR